MTCMFSQNKNCPTCHDIQMNKLSQMHLFSYENKFKVRAKRDVSRNDYLHSTVHTIEIILVEILDSRSSTKQIIFQ